MCKFLSNTTVETGFVYWTCGVIINWRHTKVSWSNTNRAMDGVSFLLTAPEGKKVTPLAARRALLPFGKIKSCTFTRDGRIAAIFEEKILGVPECLTVDGLLIKIVVDTPRRAKGTIYSRDLVGCSEEEVALELKGQVTGVKALSTRTSQTNSGRFLLFFADDVPELVRLDCGLQLSVRPNIPLPLRCRSCFVYGHHEGECDRAEVCEKCNAPRHPGPCGKPPQCAACGGDHPVTSPDCPTWKKEMTIQRFRTENGISRAAAVIKLKQANNPATLSRPPTASNPPLPMPRTAGSYARAVSQAAAPPATDTTNALMAVIDRLEAAVHAQTKMIEALTQQNCTLFAAINALMPSLATPSLASPAQNTTPGNRAKRQRLTCSSTSQPRINIALAPASSAITPAAQQSATSQQSPNRGESPISSPMATNDAVLDNAEK